MGSRILVFFVVVACIFTLTNGDQATRRCKSQIDCLPSECCATRIFTNQAYCVPRRQEGEMCLVGGMSEELIDGVYDITCPCEGNLKCLKEEHTLPNGETVPLGNPRCRRPNYAGLDFYYNKYIYG